VPIPDFIVALRALVGRHELWLPGVTAVVRRGEGAAQEVLLVQRVDDGTWTPVTGIPDPREEPAVAAAREVLEETGVTARVDRLALVSALGPFTYANGDRASYLDLAFACTYVEGEAHVGDDESRDVAWVRRDALDAVEPPVGAEMRRRIDACLSDDREARFVR
jgi:8-oxo-dGTP pyrophosphatase MutT (NUDIX family)